MSAAKRPVMASKASTQVCVTCHQLRRALIEQGTPDHPYGICGACLHREQRRQNTREMYGRGRRGY